MGIKQAVAATLHGAAFGLFPISWIVFSSILLYRIAVDTGRFEIIKDSLGALTDDRRLQLLLVAFSFSSFIEGSAGFGSPVAVAALALGVRPRTFTSLYMATLRQLALPIVTIASVLALAYVMNYAGMTSTLGLAFAATGVAFPFFSQTLGWLGVVLTGSVTSSNALFGNLQVVTGTSLAISPILTASANASGGGHGKDDLASEHCRRRRGHRHGVV